MKYDEPVFHQSEMDNPDNACFVILSDEELLEYLAKIRKKTCDYIDTLTDDMPYEKSENCPYTRLELILRQFRHLSFHTGMVNGQTAEHIGKFSIYVSEDSYLMDAGYSIAGQEIQEMLWKMLVLTRLFAKRK